MNKTHTFVSERFKVTSHVPLFIVMTHMGTDGASLNVIMDAFIKTNIYSCDVLFEIALVSDYLPVLYSRVYSNSKG